ncbi:MucR family transcriptional regulator [Methylobacterium dankookense]|uniref:Transcriptional regulatory protein ros n=1 Tax=Methylobacterium dankookense TaxID=560405 RepID=A0A564FZJ6_9HYPH|nr:MucR family transcriptional regulator [Methylobacterium dankookense]GJD58476.1 hypothetical protein IFDJLNFL_4397 [Methylobacterium dankookense]VUF13158.1 Transcriptional regulatory protein ros [Methylobacterium dankookense]
MSDSSKAIHIEQVEMTAEIVSAYVTRNHVQVAELSSLIGSVHEALCSLGKPAEVAEPAAPKPTPAQVRKSISRDGLVSFIDGKSYKTLKRHLAGHGLDPHSYRERFGLPADYPMTAVSYSEQRSALARSLGLGRKAEQPPPAPPAPAETPAATPKPRGRRKKAQAAA